MAKFCPNCGNPVNENQDVCLNCGNAINKGMGGQNNNNVYRDPNAKSKLVAGLLGIFVGSLGIHNFYLGYNSKGLTQLLLTILSCGILGVVSGIWGLVEGIQILTGTISVDAQGKPLSE